MELDNKLVSTLSVKKTLWYMESLHRFLDEDKENGSGEMGVIIMGDFWYPIATMEEGVVR